MGTNSPAEGMKTIKRAAPIALFAWQRPDHLRRVIESLLRNPEAKESRLYVFVDGPRNASEKRVTNKILNVLDEIRGFLSLEVIVAESNLGLSQSIISGINKVMQIHDRIIVVEDDIVVSENFLMFMNSGLEKFDDEPRVSSIHGYTYPTRGKLPNYFFIRGADCWGWATWRSSWQLFEPNSQLLLNSLEDSDLVDQFDFDGYGGYLDLLRRQMRGEVDSWAVRWYASTFLADTYTLYPGRSLVQNIGMDGTGSHFAINRRYEVAFSNGLPYLGDIEIRDNELARVEFTNFFRDLDSNSDRSFFQVLIRRTLKSSSKILSAKYRQKAIKRLPPKIKTFLG